MTGFRCTVCGGTAFVTGPDNTITCTRCGSVHEPGKAQACPDCGATNPPGAKYCAECGRALDLVGYMLQTRLRSPRERPEQDLERIAELKEMAESASQERLSQWWSEEEERRRQMALQRIEQKKKERRILIGVIVAAILVLLVILTLVVLSAISSGPAAHLGPGTVAASLFPVS